MPKHSPAASVNALAEQRVVPKVQYIKDLSFEVPRAPAIYLAIRNPPSLDVQTDVTTRLMTEGDRTYEVALVMRLRATEIRPANTALGPIEFLAELSYAGLFSLAAIPDDLVDEALFVDCPHILFPFACGILADLTRDANFPPVQIQPIDFIKNWENQRARHQV